MCFVTDDDFVAQVYEEQEHTAGADLKCFECQRPIKAGEKFIWRHWQEHSYCQNCGNDYDECECDDPPDVGYDDEQRTCQNCEKFRKSVAAVEIDEGCAPGESQPNHGEMFFECRQNGKQACAKYLRRMRRDFPETIESGYFKHAVERLL